MPDSPPGVCGASDVHLDAAAGLLDVDDAPSWEDSLLASAHAALAAALELGRIADELARMNRPQVIPALQRIELSSDYEQARSAEQSAMDYLR